MTHSLGQELWNHQYLENDLVENRYYVIFAEWIHKNDNYQNPHGLFWDEVAFFLIRDLFLVLFLLEICLFIHALSKKTCI